MNTTPTNENPQPPSPAPAGSVIVSRETGASATIMGSDELGVMVRHKSGRLRRQSWNTFRKYWRSPGANDTKL